MTNIFNFFLSFDKLMKEKLVKAFYWLALIAIFLTFGATVFDTIWLGPLAGVLRFIGFFVFLLLSIISLRLLCEAAIALFRINDNLSPDGGKGETADVDLIEEARRAAEVAAAKARDAAKSATEKTKSALDKTKDAAEDLGDRTSDVVNKTSEAMKEKTRSAAASVKRKTSGEDITIEPEPKTKPKPKAKPKPKTTAAKTTAKKASAKKAPAKKTATTKTSIAKTSGTRLKKDGTPAKRPGPKPKS